MHNIRKIRVAYSSAFVAAALHLGTPPAWANEDYIPAAHCAALWSAQDRYTRLSTYLDNDTERYSVAFAFREVALRLAGDSNAVDAAIAAQRPLMVRLIDSYIYDNDKTSRDLFERLSLSCEDLAQEYPETREF